MAEEEQFSLVWNSFPRNLSSGLYNLLNDEQLVDVTLAAEGQILRAHKLILSVCSTYFKEIFKINSCKHPIVILKDVNYRDLSAMLHFMYQGEVHVRQEDLASFLKVAETLQIKGLTKEKAEKDDDNSSKPEENFAEKSTKDLKKLEPTALALDNDESTIRAEDDLSPAVNISQTISSTEDLISKTGSKNFYNQVLHRRETSVVPDSIIREILSNRSNEFEERVSRRDDEPLDYTSDIGKLTRAKNEPLDYTSDIEFDVLCNKDYSGRDNVDDQRGGDVNMENNSIANDRLPDSRLLAYNLNHQDEPLSFSHLEAAFHGYDHGGYNGSKKTGNGISGGSLPLETTLRVVSELGPTLRIERGKVTRMYSCPWCLRHFTRKENLKLHVKYIHGPLESLTCKLCGNKYKNSNSLRVHSYLYHNNKRNKHAKPEIVDSSM